MKRTVILSALFFSTLFYANISFADLQPYFAKSMNVGGQWVGSTEFAYHSNGIYVGYILPTANIDGMAVWTRCNSCALEYNYWWFWSESDTWDTSCDYEGRKDDTNYYRAEENNEINGVAYNAFEHMMLVQWKIEGESTQGQWIFDFPLVII